MKKVHFIAIGGRAMHSLAIALKKSGYEVTGSDCEIYEPSKSHLMQAGLYPAELGWFPEKITDDLNTVILGMHAAKDNPELLEAQKKEIKIVSYSEFVYEKSKNKFRVVIGGSYGKTTITSMIMHLLNFYEKDHDYMIGAEIKGFETCVRLSETAEICVLEGDEYLSSVLDDRPKFLHFRPNIAILTGIAWEHVNAFPTFEIYIGQFRKYIDSIEPNGVLIYNGYDVVVKNLVEFSRDDIKKIPYFTHPYEVFENRNFLKINGGRIPVSFFGEYNMQNISGAILACQHLKISEEKFYKAIISFKIAGKRLELIRKNETVNVFLDKAHSSQRLTATLKALREQYPGKEIIACMEVHGEGGISKEYLKQYYGCLDLADIRMVYYDQDELKDVTGEPFKKETIKKAFGNASIKVFNNMDELLSELYSLTWKNKNLILMSNSTFSGTDFEEIAKKVTNLS